MKQKEAVKKSKIKEAWKELQLGAILSVAISFLFCIYAPMELYCNNKGEFWFDGVTLLPVLLVLFLLVFIVCMGILLILYRICVQACRIGIAVYLIGYLASYIQGTFFVKQLPHLDGTQVDWTLYQGQRWVSLIIWVILIIAVILTIRLAHMERFLVIAKGIGCFLSAVLLITLVSVMITNHAFERKINAYVSTRYEYEFSENENLIVLVLDAADARTMTAMLDTHPEYREMFADFTDYQNVLSGYPFTMHSIPFILSGEWYQNEEPFTDYEQRVYQSAELFDTLEERGYRMGMYEDEVPLLDSSIYRFENIKEAEGLTPSEFLLFMKRELQLVGFRYAPFDMKRYCLVTGASFQELRGTNYEYPTYSFNNARFYEDLQQAEVTTTNDKCFKFIHIEGAHTPFQYDADVNVIENGSYESNMEAAMTITGRYLDTLKAAGVYNNSAIVIMADHGYDVEGNTTGRQNPILFIKGRGETHDTMQVSETPISHEDMPEAFQKLLDGAPGNEVFAYEAGSVRERRYLFYYYEQENHMEEYVTNGEAKDTDALVPTGIVYDWKE